MANWSVPKEIDEYDKELEEMSQKFQERREIIPKIKGFPSGEALIDVLEAMSDRYFKKLATSDPSHVASMGYYQGAYHAINKVISEIEGESKDEQGI